MVRADLDAIFDAQDLKRHARSERQGEMSLAIAVRGDRIVAAYSPLKFERPKNRSVWKPRTVDEALEFGEINRYGR